jgi:hypothetical protein
MLYFKLIVIFFMFIIGIECGSKSFFLQKISLVHNTTNKYRFPPSQLILRLSKFNETKKSNESRVHNTTYIDPTFIIL